MTKIVVVKSGDTLKRIAAKVYGDPNQWRRIAKANNIVNPRKLKPGTELVIPPLE
ncbi:MAG: LysM peptidoglycan-binding domain-containing protein [Candidatus Lokiarchaeia archaeon]